jgi:hypothetical protein
MKKFRKQMSILELEDDFIAVKDKSDVIRAAELLEKVGIVVFGTSEKKQKFIESETGVDKNFLVEDEDDDGPYWRIQSHYIGFGTSTDLLEEKINEYLEKNPKIKEQKLAEEKKLEREKNAVSLKIPKDDLEEVIHLLRYSLSSQRVSNDVWTLLMPFCEDNSEIKFDGKEEDFLTYDIDHNNNK